MKNKKPKVTKEMKAAAAAMVDVNDAKAYAKRMNVKTTPDGKKDIKESVALAKKYLR